MDYIQMHILSTIQHKMFEANSTFYVKQCTMGKVQFPFLRSFLLVLVLTKCLLWKEDWALGYNAMKFRDFHDIS